MSFMVSLQVAVGLGAAAATARMQLSGLSVVLCFSPFNSSHTTYFESKTWSGVKVNKVNIQFDCAELHNCTVLHSCYLDTSHLFHSVPLRKLLPGILPVLPRRTKKAPRASLVVRQAEARMSRFWFKITKISQRASWTKNHYDNWYEHNIYILYTCIYMYIHVYVYIYICIPEGLGLLRWDRVGWGGAITFKYICVQYMCDATLLYVHWHVRIHMMLRSGCATSRMWGGVGATIYALIMLHIMLHSYDATHHATLLWCYTSRYRGNVKQNWRQNMITKKCK